MTLEETNHKDPFTNIFGNLISDETRKQLDAERATRIRQEQGQARRKIKPARKTVSAPFLRRVES